MRRGHILIQHDMFAEMLHAPDEAKHALINAPFDTIHAALLLPPSYRVVGLEFDLQCYMYRVYLESEHLPDVRDGSYSPPLYPFYTRFTPENEPAYTRLTSLELEGKRLPLE